MLGRKQDSYKTDDLRICDIRMVTSKKGTMIKYNNLPYYAICERIANGRYMDVISGAIYAGEKATMQNGEKNDKFALAVRKFPKSVLVAKPRMTLEEIKRESYRLNESGRTTYYCVKL